MDNIKLTRKDKNMLTHKQLQVKLQDLENEGMVDMMFHQWSRFKSVNSLQINMTALWQKWVRR